MSDGISDPNLYREMSIPFPSSEVAQVAMEKFYEEVRESRKRNKIQDVLIVVEFGAIGEGGKEVTYLNSCTCGSQLKEEYLAAYALGVATASHDELVARALKRSRGQK